MRHFGEFAQWVILEFKFNGTFWGFLWFYRSFADFKFPEISNNIWLEKEMKKEKINLEDPRR